ncbi:transposase [Streptomyces goshikiensis]|uniref:transposase n=1 Tax=Streptomyces goshikiensis TaxID=1942 RepID=UPI0036BBC919
MNRPGSVEIIHRACYPVQVAESLGVSRESVRRWVSQHEIDTGVAAGVTSDEREELRRLWAENKRLREVNEVLKSATIFFAGELDPETVDRRLRRPDEGSRSCRRVDPHRPEHRRPEDRGTNLACLGTTYQTIVNTFNQHRDRAFRARELHELLDIPTDDASVNITRSRLGRLTRQGFLTQPGRGRYQKRT